MKFKYGKRKQLSIFSFDGIHVNCAKNKHLWSGSSLRGSRLNSPQCIFLDRIFCAIPTLISEQLSEECQENRELIQAAAYRSPLTVKIDLM